MYPSSKNCEPFPFNNQNMLGSSSSSSLFFPEPFLADNDNELLMTHFLSQHQILVSADEAAAETNKTTSPKKEIKKITTKKKKSESNGEKQAIPQKRSGKKDRHSKIYTAQGPRDRRMRLSLQIARKFFDLQDMLGFDKASKTIEWLFSKSKAAIKELTESLPNRKHSCSGGGGKSTLSSTSESEVISGIFKDNRDLKGTLTIGESSVRGATNRKSRKAITINPLERESRDKARARARERTLGKKMKIKGLVEETAKQCSDEANPNDLELLGSASPLQTTENLGSCSQEMNSSVKVATHEDQEEPSSTLHLAENEMDSVTIIEKFLGITSSPRSSSIFNYSLNVAESSGANSHQNNPVFPGNWDDIESDHRIHYSYSSLTNTRESTGNLLVQNSNAIFITNPNAQEQISMTIAKADQNPNSVFITPSNAHEQNPSSILMTTANNDSHSHFLQNQFSSNPIASDKYFSLY
ncbi:hypothetical protein Dsin_009647 [Dipteronia sinensis]|uniref:Uncharacterized protein n=1 Tax=Dipteronia sinensis TaxID=43782 RepID=A0AAE0ECA4_9ROSI|nr:hypothetical protein Dsin_009647 [Dipteronia sinensis]